MLADKIKAFFFLGLFLYSIFTELNYIFFPSYVNQYFLVDDALWIAVWAFITLSFISFYGFFAFSLHAKRKYSIVTQSNEYYSAGIVFVYTIVLLIDLIIIIRNWDSLSYFNDVSRNFGSDVAFIRYLNNFNCYFFLIVMSKLRYSENNSHQSKRLLYLSAIICFLDLILYTFKVGDRSIILQVLIGSLIIYLHNKEISRKLIIKLCFLLVGAAIYLMIVRLTRNNISVLERKTIIESIMTEDYSRPALTLFGAIKFSIIHPFEVIKSFFAKASFVLHYKYLYETVYSYAFPIFIQQAAISGSNPGIGMHIFTEGYIFMGFLGFIYNGMVLNIHISLWEKLCKTNDEQTNVTFSAIMIGVMLLNIRGETVYFVRNFVFFIIPAIIMYMIVCNRSFHLSRG